MQSIGTCFVARITIKKPLTLDPPIEGPPRSQGAPEGQQEEGPGVCNGLATFSNPQKDRTVRSESGVVVDDFPVLSQTGMVPICGDTLSGWANGLEVAVGSKKARFFLF